MYHIQYIYIKLQIKTKNVFVFSYNFLRLPTDTKTSEYIIIITKRGYCTQYKLCIYYLVQSVSRAMRK